MAERSLRIPCGVLTLEASLETPSGDGPFPAVVICHPHPQYGGDMHNNVVAAIAAGALQHGIAALRLNFRGVGGSDGEHDGGEGERDDVRAALSSLASLDDIDADRVGLAGYSFGAGVCAGLAEPRVPALALVALPATAMVSPQSPLASYAGELLLMAGDLDHISDADLLVEIGDELAADVDLRIIEGADHFWRGFESIVAEATGGFFAGALG